MGINAAIEAYAETEGLDLADFCVIPCYSQDPTFLELVAEAKEDPSANAIKGYASSRGSIHHNGRITAISDVDRSLSRNLFVVVSR